MPAKGNIVSLEFFVSVDKAFCLKIKAGIVPEELRDFLQNTEDMISRRGGVMIKWNNSTCISMTCTKKVLLPWLSRQKEALCHNHSGMT